MWSTPAATAARSTRSASSRSRGGPKTPSPASCIAPYPARRTRHRPSAKDPPSSRPCPVTVAPVGMAGPRRLPSRVDLRAGAEVEADRLEEDERRAGGVDVGGGQDAGVLLDD